MSQQRVVVTGVGVVSPIGNDVPAFWNGILEGRSGAGPITRFDTSDFRSHFACELQGFDAKACLDAKRLRTYDRFTQYAVVAAIQAVADSQLEIANGESPQDIGVITGSGIGGIDAIEANARALFERGPGRISPFFIPMMMINAAAGQLAIHFGFQGPNYSTVSACASAQHALGAAYDLIVSGQCRAVLVGASEAAITPLGVGGFNNMKALSTRNDEPETASRPFCKSRDGFVMGEGAGMFVFESEERARARGARIYCEVRGFATTDDAHHIAAPLPSGEMAAAAMRGAVARSGLNVEDIDYINAHGTSTPLNDVMESRAIRAVFGAHADKLMVSSTKSQIGHLLGASGAVELVAVALGIHQGVVPATINNIDPDPECDLDYVPNEARRLPVRTVLSNSFGFGGQNACLVFQAYMP